MNKCFSGTCFTILTLITIGLTLAIFAFATFIYAKIKTANETIFIVIIVCLCVSFLVFLFGLYASCCGKTASKVVLAVIYIIYALAIGAAGALILAFKGKLPGYFRTAYDSGKFSEADLSTISETFKCVFPPDTTGTDCFTKFAEYCDKYGIICGASLLALFVVLMIGVILVCRMICAKDGPKEDSSVAKQRNDQMNQPLTYGW